jgi:hypothetical protein
LIRNTAGQIAQSQMVNATTGAAFAGAVTVYVTIDGGTQAIGSVGGGVCTAEGNGLYSYTPSAAETNGALIAFTFIGAGAVPVTVQYGTVTAAQTQALQSATGPSVRYVLGVITNALFGLNIYHPNEAIKPADSTLCLFWLNLILDDWNLDPQASYADPFTVFASTGANPQTIGPSGDWVLPARPPSIQGVAYDIGNGIYQNIYTTDDPNWWSEQQSILTDSIPFGAYYEPAEPNGKLYFNNVLTSGTNVRLLLRMYFGRVALTDVLVLPPGYESALTLTLMEAIAEPLHANVSPSLAQRAGKARALIFSKNLRVPSLSTRGLGLPGSNGGLWDYRTGQIR